MKYSTGDILLQCHRRTGVCDAAATPRATTSTTHTLQFTTVSLIPRLHDRANIELAQ